MEPKKGPNTPDSASDVSEKTAEEEAEDALLQAHYEHVDRFIKEFEDNPRKEKGGWIQLCKEMVTKFPDIVRIKPSDAPLPEEELSKFRKRSVSFRDAFEARVIKLFSGNSPEEKERFAAQMRSIFSSRYGEETEDVLRQLKIIDTEESSESEEK